MPPSEGRTQKRRQDNAYSDQESVGESQRKRSKLVQESQSEEVSDESEEDDIQPGRLEKNHPFAAPRIMKKDMANDIRLLFSERVSVRFTNKNGETYVEMGRWCSPCRANPDLIKKHGERKAFHTGSNTSCRQHARQHFDLYKSLCEKAGISTHHWAIPRPIWADMQAGRKKHKKQMTLDSVVQKRRGPKEFTREGLLHAVTQWVACDDQSPGVADKVVFRNCLIVTRPGTAQSDLPSSRDVEKHLHNEFASWIAKLKADIEMAPGKVSTTADEWSVDTTKPAFLGVTGHWIDVKEGKWNMRSAVIGFRGISGEHSGANLGQHLVRICQRVGIVGAQTSKLLTTTLDNASNVTTCEKVESIHCQRGLDWPAAENQLACWGHVVNHGNVDIMGHITKMAAKETSTAIWEYDPSLPDNRVLNGTLDVIAAIRTLAAKMQSSSPRIENFSKFQLECNITDALEIPLYSDSRWSSAFRMLDTAYRLRKPIDLFVAAADQRYGPITTIRCNGHIQKHIPWTAFTMTDDDWKRVREAADILADSNRAQQYFSAKKPPTLWRVLPAIEDLQTAWEKKRDSPRFAQYRDALSDGLANINKYYSRFDEKPSYIIALALHPYYKLAYIEHAWGGAKEQEAERKAGNRHAKNWKEEARKVLARTMQHYWNIRPNAPTPKCDLPNDKPDDESMASEYDRLRHSRLLSQGWEEGWEAELHKYLKDYPADVTKDTDLVQWWQDNGYIYPTWQQIALDYLPCLATSVPCEHLFPAGGEVATKRRAQFGAALFEELQIMKFVWGNNRDLAGLNSSQVEEVDDSELKEYKKILAAEEERVTWDEDDFMSTLNSL